MERQVRWGIVVFRNDAPLTGAGDVRSGVMKFWGEAGSHSLFINRKCGEMGCPVCRFAGDEKDPALPETRQPSSIAEKVKETLTPQRLSLTAWALAAILFGSIGFASVQFSEPALNFNDRFAAIGTPLPPNGPVSVTGSIDGDGPRFDIGIHERRDAPAGTPTEDALRARIDMLERQFISMRQVLDSYSDQQARDLQRLAVLEHMLENARAPEEDASRRITPVIPDTGMAVTGMPTPEAAKPVMSEGTDAHPSAPGEPIASAGRDAAVEVVPIRETQQPADFDPLAGTPVRIVALPTGTSAPEATGSIDPQQQSASPAPAANPLRPQIVEPSAAVGRLRGTGGSVLQRSDFGAVVGQYATRSDAVVAWAGFAEQNDERMRNLQPLLLAAETSENAVQLMVGPFGNAADAAAACLQLLDMTATCHPALFAGEALSAEELALN